MDYFPVTLPRKYRIQEKYSFTLIGSKRVQEVYTELLPLFGEIEEKQNKTKFRKFVVLGIQFSYKSKLKKNCSKRK